jgi:hypothetical protein
VDVFHGVDLSLGQGRRHGAAVLLSRESNPSREGGLFGGAVPDREPAMSADKFVHSSVAFEPRSGRRASRRDRCRHSRVRMLGRSCADDGECVGAGHRVLPDRSPPVGLPPPVGNPFQERDLALVETATAVLLSTALFLIGKIAGIVNAVVGCAQAAFSAFSTFSPSALGGCFLSILAGVIGVSIGNAKSMVVGLTRRETLDGVRELEKIAAGVGVNFDLAGLIVSLVGKITDD